METIKIKEEFLTRAAVQPATFSEEAYTVDVVFGSDTPVRRNTDSGAIFEVLDFSPESVRLDRLNSGAPVIDNHKLGGSANDVLGVVERAWVDGRRGYATIRFSRSDQAAGFVQNIKDGILKNLSIGYRIYKYAKDEVNEEFPTFRAIDWEPMEISVVPMPEDINAQFRSADGSGVTEINVILKQQIPETMDQEEKEVTEVVETQEVKETTEPKEKVAEDVTAEDSKPEEPLQEDRERAADINMMVRSAGLEASFADDMIRKGISMDAARAAVLGQMIQNQQNTKIMSQNVTVGAERHIEGRREAISDYLYLRSASRGADKEVLGERRVAAEQFRGFTLLDIARKTIENEGVGMSGMEIAKRAISSSTSDFPVILEGTARRVLLGAYDNAPDTWRRFSSVGTVGDFRQYHRIRTGSIANLDEVHENGEYTVKAISDGQSEAISAKTKGNIINVSRQMIVNDDLGAFTTLISQLGRAAARSVESDLFALLLLNSGNGPTMGDGNPLFHALHSNIAGTAAAPTTASFDAARQQLASQLDVSGNDFLDLRPALWLGPLSLGGSARVVNGAEYDHDGSEFQKPNVSRGMVQDIIDTPRLSGTAWYLMTSPAEEPVFEVAFLNGVQAPYIEQNETFNVDGIQMKVRLDYGVGAIGWRGIVKNAGA